MRFTDFPYVSSAFSCIDFCLYHDYFLHFSSFGLFWPYLSIFLSWELTVLIWNLSSVLRQALGALPFPTSTFLSASHKFWYAACSFSYNFSYFQNFFCTASLAHGLFTSVLSGFHRLEIMQWTSCCYWFPVWFRCGREHVLWFQSCWACDLDYCLCIVVIGKHVYSTVAECSGLKILARFCWLMVLFSSCTSFLIFPLLALSTSLRRVLESLTSVLDLATYIYF